MKVLIISKAYVVALNQSKLEELSKFRDLKITLLVPNSWKTNTHTIPLEKCQSRNYDIIPAKIIFNGKGFLHFYLNNIAGCIKNLKPNIIHIEEEPWSLVALQTILLRKICSPKSKIILFTWENIYRKVPPPFSFFEKYILNNVDLIIAGNKEVKEILISKKGYKKEVKVLPQFGVDLSSFKKFKSGELKKKLSLKGFVIGFVGRFVKEKGVHLLVEAMSKIKNNYKLLLVGRGNYKKEILKLIKKLGIGNKVLVIEDASHLDIPKYINCMDVLVLPSITIGKWKEQFGHVLIEAMACGVPVVGSDSGGIPDVIGKAGLVFKENDVSSLRNKLKMLMGNGKLRGELSEKGLERAVQKYSNQRITSTTYKIYKNLINNEN